MPRTSRLLPAAGLLAAVLAVLAGLTPAEAAKPAKAARRLSVRIGLVQTLFRDMPEPLMQVIMRPFKSLMETQTGVTSTLVNGGGPEALAAKLKDNQVQLGVFHGFEFAWARLKYPELKPLLIAVNEQPYVRAHLVVRADSPAGGVGDLKGQSLAFPHLSKEHCRLFLERRCTLPGVAPDKFYSAVTPAGDAEEALDAVVEGKVNAAVLDEVALRHYSRLKPEQGQKLRTLLQSETLPSAVLACWPGAVDEDIADRFRTGMVSARKTRKGQEMLQMCRITGFDEVPADYEALFESTAKAYPPPAPPSE